MHRMIFLLKTFKFQKLSDYEDSWLERSEVQWKACRSVAGEVGKDVVVFIEVGGFHIVRLVVAICVTNTTVTKFRPSFNESQKCDQKFTDCNGFSEKMSVLGGPVGAPD